MSRYARDKHGRRARERKARKIRHIAQMIELMRLGDRALEGFAALERTCRQLRAASAYDRVMRGDR